MPLSLTEALQPLNWPTLVLVSARVVALMLVAPLWSMSAMPRTLRGAVAVVLTLALLPVAPRASLPPEALGLVVPLAGEFLLGLTVGLAGAVFLHGVGMAAEVLNLQMGLSLGSALAPMAEVSTPGLGELKGFFALSIYVALGGHLTLIYGLAESLVAIPPGTAMQLTEGSMAALRLAGTVFDTALRVAAPVMVALLVTNLALAILNRAVPQLNTMMVAVPVTVSVGLIVLGASIPYAATYISTWVGGLGGTVDTVVRSFAPAGGP